MRGSVCGTPELSWLVDILKTASGSNPMSLGKQKLRLYVRMLLRCLTDAWKTKATLIFGIDMKLQLQNADFVNYAQAHHAWSAYCRFCLTLPKCQCSEVFAARMCSRGQAILIVVFEQRGAVIVGILCLWAFP